MRLALLISLCVLFAAGCSRVSPAEVVIRNGTIYTASPNLPKAEGIAVNGGKIVFVGSNSDLAAYVGGSTKVIDLAGSTAVPGFTDSHYHLSEVGARERTLNLESTKNTNLEDFLARVKAAAAEHKPGEWVTGRGWIESEWPRPVFPTRWDLDKVAPGNPVFLVRADGHGAVANSVALKLEKALSAVPADQRRVKDPRLRIEHAQIFHPDDLRRPAKLGVILSMQPSHAITDLHFAPSRLGMARLAGAYAWRTFIDSGAKVVGGSDAPVERGDPRIEFYAAVTRKDLSGYSGEGWHPELKVTREEALKMFTIWAAYASFEENIKGSIEPGKLADLTVFSKDIMTVPEPDILKAQTRMTIIGGEIAYELK